MTIYRRATLLLLVIILSLNLVGCGRANLRNASTLDVIDNSMFIEIEKGASWRVVYHEETKVMYVVSYASYNGGNFVLLVNPDGSPMIYEEIK